MLARLGKKSKVDIVRWPRFHSTWQVFGDAHLCDMGSVACVGKEGPHDGGLRTPETAYKHLRNK